MSKFEQLLENILDCVTESLDSEDIDEPIVIDTITESVINGDISVDECRLLLESVDDSEYHISVLDRFTEGVIDNDECIVLLEATRYEKEHTKALQELRKQNDETEKKIEALKKLKKSASDDSKEKIDNRIKKLTDDLNNAFKKYKKNYGKSDKPNIGTLSSYQKTRLELGRESSATDRHGLGRRLKYNERRKGFNVPSKTIKEPGLYLKAHQGK